jgi:succinylarginine dihydrolase
MIHGFSRVRRARTTGNLVMYRIASELNFDGLVGPTHNYAGLSYGNLASLKHKAAVSRPREAALQGLAKMKLLMELGVRQAVLPPQERPDLRTLRRLGFGGRDAQVVERAWREDPVLLAACYSASAMWTANAATVSPSMDASDDRVHFTPANLVSQFHRSLEPRTVSAVLRRMFADEARFAHHDPLPSGIHYCDEGAANHTRLCVRHGEPGIESFAYGKRAFEYSGGSETVAEAPIVRAVDRIPGRFPARQTYEATAAIARLHLLDPARTVFVQQHPKAIDAGVFHNDVIAVGNENVLLYHEMAFADAGAVEQMRVRFVELTRQEPVLIEVRNDQVPLEEAVASYLFNSQLVTLPDGSMAMIVPTECDEFESTRQWLDALPQRGTPIRQVRRVNLRQSMQNGGGPACLRLRVVLREDELAAMHQGVLLDDRLLERLRKWVERHYREELRPGDLADPRLIGEGRAALDELTQILELGAVYSFQSGE